MKLIPGYPEYFASEQGEIYSGRQGELRKIATRPHKGYLHVNIKTGYGRHTQKKEPVHKLVLLAFHGHKPNEDMVCRHLNGNPTDNQPMNLKWGTTTENVQDSIRHGTAVCLRLGEEHPASKLSVGQILFIHNESNKGVRQKTLADMFGIDQKHVSNIKLKRTWKHLWMTA